MTTMVVRRHPIASQDGFALPAAILVLFVILGLTAAAVTVSVQTNSTTRRDDNVKAALAAAESGLQTAIYRLDMLHPEELGKLCVGQTTVEAAGSDGYCKEGSGELGNGASYTYWTSEALVGSGCVGQTVMSQVSLIQRCVVAEGSVNGITRRVAERVAAFTASPLFPVRGVTGLKEVTLSNNATVKGSAGSNGKITIASNAEVSGGCVLGPSGQATPEGSCRGGVFKHSTAEGPLTLGSVDPGNSATENINYYITNYLNYIKNHELKLPELYDQAVKVAYPYNNEPRRLSMENNSLLVLHEGTYNFCSFEAMNNATIELAAGAKVVIYIDSASRPGSECAPSGSGVLKIKNNATIINPSRDPTALVIYVYGGSGGNDGSSGEVNIQNNAELFLTLYAPHSNVKIENNGSVHGAIAGEEVELENNLLFEWDERDSTLKTGTVGNYYRSNWAECTPTATAGNPESGC